MNLLILVATLFLSIQASFADQLVCRGANTTLKLTDVRDYEDKGEVHFVYAQVWSEQHDSAKYADLFSDSYTRRVRKVAQILEQKTLSITGAFGSQLEVNLVKKSLKVRSERGAVVKDSTISCKLIPRKPIMFNDIVGT
ncbi:MAG: hypothetical protein AB7I27_09320 [Bacteriovoracaceae bacterium]